MIKGLNRFEVDFSLATSAGIAAAVGLGVALIAWCALVRTGLVHKFVEKMVKKQSEMEGTKGNGETEFEIVQTRHSDDEEYDEEANDETTLKNTTHANDVARSPSVPHPSPKKSRLQRLKEKATYGMNVDICDESNMNESEAALHDRSEKFDPRTER